MNDTPEVGIGLPNAQGVAGVEFKLERVRSPESALHVPEVEPWPEAVSGELLLNDLRRVLERFVILPKWGSEALALWIVHTYASELRDVSAYVGIESPVKRCGKTTLLTLLSELVNRPVVAANISPSAFFRVIEESRPTLLIDEADTALHKNDELRGILNAGYKRETAYVVRVTNQAGSGESKGVREEGEARGAGTRSTAAESRIVRFSTWCPKAIAAIGHLPETLADRCILIRMQRKTPKEQCERLRKLRGAELRRLCARFVQDHGREISSAEPELPLALHDRAADVWEPLLAVAEVAGGDWPKLGREAAVGLTLGVQESSPMGALFVDILVVFSVAKAEVLLSRTLIEGLASQGERPWLSLRRGREITERWLADRLREYEIRPRLLRVGETVGRGYVLEDFGQAFKRYISQSELEALHTDCAIWEGPKTGGGKREEPNEVESEIRNPDAVREERPRVDTGEDSAA